MADVVGLLLSCYELAEKLWEYGRAVSDAKQDILVLNSELFALSGLLNDVKSRLASLSDDANLLSLLGLTRSLLDELSQKLEVPVEKSKRVWQRLTWPSRKDDVEKLVRKLADVKQSLMLCILTENTSVTVTLKDEILDFRREYRFEQESSKQLALERSQTELRELLAGPVSQQKKLNDFLKPRHPKTGAWFRDGESFQAWLDSSTPGGPRLLSIIGKSGAGKTSLLSSAIRTAQDRASQNSRSIVAFCFISFNEFSSQEPQHVLSILVSQLAEAFPEIARGLKGPSQNDDLSLDEMEFRMIDALSRAPTTVHVFVDAVNESRHSEALLESLLRLIEGCANFYLCFTSTVEEQIMEPAQPLIVPMQGIIDDLELFIHDEIEARRNLRRLAPSLKDEIRQVLSRKCEGMFRYTQCQMDLLSSQATGKLVKKALYDLPRDINDTYTQILLRIPEYDRDLAREALMWLCFCYRPLTLEQLSEALAFEESETDLDPLGKMTDPTEILRWFQGMAAPLSGDSARVSISHSSVRTFLLSAEIKTGPAAHFSFDEESADRQIMRKCLTYVLFDCFGGGYRPKMPWRLFHQSHPLMRYAAMHWGTHARILGDALSDDDAILVLRLLDTWTAPRHGNFGFWVQCLNPQSPHQIATDTQPLYYLASYGLRPLVKRWVQHRNVDLDARGGRFLSTPARIAAYRGYFDIARDLVAAGAALPYSVSPAPDSCTHDAAHLKFPDAPAPASLRDHIAQLKSLDPAAAMQSPRCVRVAERYELCGCLVFASTVVHVEHEGRFPLEELASFQGGACRSCAASLEQEDSLDAVLQPVG